MIPARPVGLASKRRQPVQPFYAERIAAGTVPSVGRAGSLARRGGSGRWVPIAVPGGYEKGGAALMLSPPPHVPPMRTDECRRKEILPADQKDVEIVPITAIGALT